MISTVFLSAPLKPVMMHIPDGFLSPGVAAVGWLLAILSIVYALRQVRGQLGERQVPLLGVMAAFIFAAQAINFPVAGGTSGHLLGGVLAGIVLGPWAGVLVMTAVIGLQGLLFQDGGLLVMGWNIVNMGVITVLIGWAAYRIALGIGGHSKVAVLAGGALGAWLSVVLAATATSAQLAMSGTSPFWIAFPTMVGVHILIGMGEAAITVGALALIWVTRPDLLKAGEEAQGKRSAAFLAGGLLVAVSVAAFSFLASPSPDGLERVAMDRGFIEQAENPLYHILPDYTIPFVSNATVSGIAAVILGTLVVFGVAVAVGYAIRRSRVTSETGRP